MNDFQKTVALFVLLFPAFATTQSTGASAEESRAVLIKQIEAGDVGAIRKAGESGDTRFVPYLKKTLHNGKNAASVQSTHEVARIALARLDDPEQLQRIWCAAIVKNDPMVFKQVGGWYSIQALQRFLAPGGPVHWDDRSNRYFSKHQDKYNDTLQLPASFHALKVLPDVVPNPPIKADLQPGAINGPQADPAIREREIRIWQDWIAEHKNDLIQLKPNGESVSSLRRHARWTGL